MNSHSETAKRWARNHPEYGRKRLKDWRKKNPVKVKAQKRRAIENRKKAHLCLNCREHARQNRVLCAPCSEKKLHQTKLTNASVKKEVFNHYGGKCVCCEEPNFKFLTLDHKNNNGSIHRKELKIRGSSRFYRWVQKNNYPDFLQASCWNCNCGRQYNGGVCPHKDARI